MTRKVIFAVLSIAAACGSGGGSDAGHGDAAVDAGTDRAVDAADEGVPAADAGDAAASDAVAGDTVTQPDARGFEGTIVGTDDKTCNALDNTGPYISPTQHAQGEQPPTLHGGTVTDGRYELVSVDYYPGSAPAPRSLYHRTTQFLQGGTAWQWVDLFPSRPGTPPDGAWTIVRRTSAVTWTPDGAFTIGAMCGNTVTTNWQFEAGAGAITIWEPTDRLLERYVAVP